MKKIAHRPHRSCTKCFSDKLEAITSPMTGQIIRYLYKCVDCFHTSTTHNHEVIISKKDFETLIQED